ncbi:hypothetical protein [Sphaerimonospora thailandensis]|uniref:Uncharacterized protein n=1 Tax=Sphaerimonospora thailandensis TaxID=795644 RepID=A0A8J3R6M9_9ACTN|nr:hypothetical protein [Sphaerimonospora thailandensis]GIH70286.1 hypothetical protein Mth01_25390 [Sphaerimonospora thailandensis]
MSDLDQDQAGVEVDVHLSPVERAAAEVPPYASAWAVSAMVTLIVAAAVVTGSPVVVVAMAAIAIAAGWWGAMYGIQVGRKREAGRVRAARQEMARLQEDKARADADLARVSGAIETLASEWVRLHPAVPDTCVRQLREIHSTRMEGR